LLNLDRTFLLDGFQRAHRAAIEDDAVSQKSYRTIVRQLDERIALADCVLVRAAMYFNHRSWIQSETEALEFGKPIIAIAPRGQERSPSELAHIACETVG